MQNNIIFGTDGWRGLLDSEMNSESVSLVAQAFADYCKDRFNNTVVAIGYDGRRNSKYFAGLFASVLKGNGIQVFLSNRIIPTPVLSYFVKAKNLNAGVMITASHNPPEYNGVKFKASYGGSFLTEETLHVENYLGKSGIKKYSNEISETDLFEPYLSHINQLINFEEIKKSNLKVLIDSMSGAGTTIIEDILNEHDCPAKTIFGSPDENFTGRLAEPIEVNLKPLAEKLQSEKGFALGVATDGDADRLGVMLENGDWLSAQETILLLADYIKNKKGLEGDLVKTSSVTDKLRIYFENDKCKVYDVQVGFKYICEKMIASKIAFGAEESGGFGYSGHIPERDGILSALLMIEMIASSGYNKLSDYVEFKRKQFGKIFYDRIDYKYENKDRAEKLPAIYNNPPDSILSFDILKIEKYFSSRKIINGLKFFLEGETRWLLLRASETEPLVRIYAEGQSEQEVEDLLSFGKKLID